MGETLVVLLTPINNCVWGPVMLVLLVGTGLYLNIGLKFYPFRNRLRAYRCLWEGRKHQSGEGEISPWNALMTAVPPTSAPAASWASRPPSPSAARAPCSGCG